MTQVLMSLGAYSLLEDIRKFSEIPSMIENILEIWEHWGEFKSNVRGKEGLPNK